jgi:dihydroxyacetone kinase-like predicted kinase
MAKQEIYRNIFKQGNLKIAAQLQQHMVKLLRQLKLNPTFTKVMCDQWDEPKFKVFFTHNNKNYMIEAESAHKEDGEMWLRYKWKNKNKGDFYAKVDKIFDNAKDFKKILDEAIDDVMQEDERYNKSETLDYRRKLEIKSKSAKEAMERISKTHPQLKQLIEGRLDFCAFKTYYEGLTQFELDKINRKMFTLFNHLIRTSELQYNEASKLTNYQFDFNF